MTALRDTLCRYLQAPGVKVLSVLAPEQRDRSWSRSVSISYPSTSIEKNPSEAFAGWQQGMGFSDTSQFLILSRSSCDAMRAQHPESVCVRISPDCCLSFLIYRAAGLERTAFQTELDY